MNRMVGAENEASAPSSSPSSGSRRIALPDLGATLDRAEGQLLRANADAEMAHAALHELFLALHVWRFQADEEQWQRAVTQCRAHPLLGLVHQDPFTFRAFDKPRGYAGDACLMDFIYRVEDGGPLPQVLPIGRFVYDYLTANPACQGVRSRRAVVAELVDRLAAERPRPHVLSIAAGHLREANLSVAIRRRRLGRLLAVDSDAESLAEVSACYGHLGVETLPASFRTLLGNKAWRGQFDLVYSTGLFDYLSLRTGRRLVLAMYQMLRPGGSLVIANFLPGVLDTGYMEAFMDWKLVYRSRQDMIELTRDIPESGIRQIQLRSEEAQNILFLELTRS